MPKPLTAPEGLGDIHAVAELAGIFAGDGTLYRTSTGQVLEIRGASEERAYNVRTVKPLFDLVTGIDATLTRRSYRNGCRIGHLAGIRCCKKEVRVIFHDILGFPIGDKCKTVEVPRMILREKQAWVDYVRGLFDTDGSIYLTKTGKGRAKHPVASICSSADRHKAQLHLILLRLGFANWIERERVSTGGWSTVDRFFQVVRPHNPKHLRRFARFYAGRGSQAWHGDG
ncbi:MAG: hypothetical protein OK441_04565 [Thaumarchaeota archaeon]|nr:hypothetical protein [Nitrososphaerota archaeon]